MSNHVKVHSMVFVPDKTGGANVSFKSDDGDWRRVGWRRVGWGVRAGQLQWIGGYRIEVCFFE